MKVLFKSRDPEAIAMHSLAKARSEFVFRRLAWLISKATVSLSDINGPRGGVDKRCQVELQVTRERSVVVTSIARDWRAAIDLAHPVRGAGVVQHPLGDRGLAGVDVGNDADVADLAQFAGHGFWFDNTKEVSLLNISKSRAGGACIQCVSRRSLGTRIMGA